MSYKLIIVLVLVLYNVQSIFAQDTIFRKEIGVQDSTIAINNKAYSLNYKQLIVPTVLIGYGFASLGNKILIDVNFSVRNTIRENRVKQTKMDDYTQYFPALMVYGLNAAGMKGENDFAGRTIIYATAMLISSAFVTSLKRIVKEERPDGANSLSFPSGHTSTAFVSAQFLYKEYRDTNFWLSISGYPFAVFTGVYRVINDRHWVGNIVAGAGFGILSTELAYWLYPKINRLIHRDQGNMSTMLLPFYEKGGYGLSLVRNF